MASPYQAGWQQSYDALRARIGEHQQRIAGATQYEDQQSPEYQAALAAVPDLNKQLKAMEYQQQADFTSGAQINAGKGMDRAARAPTNYYRRQALSATPFAPRQQSPLSASTPPPSSFSHMENGARVNHNIAPRFNFQNRGVAIGEPHGYAEGGPVGGTMYRTDATGSYAVADEPADQGWLGASDGSSLPVGQNQTAVTRLYNPANAEHKALMKQLAESLQGIIASGNEDEARRIYNEKKALYGFTDDEFGPYTAGMGELPATGATGQQVTTWAGAQPVTPVTPVTPTPVIPVDTGGQQVVNTIDNASTNGDQTVRDLTTGGVNSPGVIGNQNVTGNTVTGAGNILGNNNISNSNNTADNRTYQGWGTAGATAPTFQTPVLDALYAQQQQNMSAPMPTFDFQKKYRKGGVVSPLMTKRK